MALPTALRQKWKLPKIPGLVWRILSFVAAVLILVICITQ